MLAVGGDLSVPRLIQAYRQGIFPWFSEGDPILWWSPDPRGVIWPEQLHISRSLRKFLKRCDYRCTINIAFEQVVSGCIQQRAELEGSWITDDMYEAYCNLHDAGHAHSIEVWQGEQLVGGLYGVMNGRIFCGESMSHRADHASKVALIALIKHFTPAKLALIDCQMLNPHLSSLGATSLSRTEFIHCLHTLGNDTVASHYREPQSISGIYP